MSHKFLSAICTPQDWKPVRISSLAGNLGVFKDGDWIELPYITNEGVRLIQTGNVGIGKYREQGFRYISLDTFHALRCTEVKPGDVLICRLADPVGRACIAPDLGGMAVTSVDNVILRVSQDYDSRYLVYLFSSKPYLEYLESECRGGTRNRVSRSFLGRLRIPVPHLSTQRTIADFLDRETARIDQLTEKREAFLSIIEEKKAALGVMAVNGALLDRARDGEIGWFGILPGNWPIRRGKYLFRERQHRSDSGSEELLTVSHITGVTKRSEKDVNMFMAENLAGYKLAFCGDVVVNTMWAWMGAIGVAPLGGLVSPSYAVYAPVAEHYDHAYLDLLLRSRPFVAEVNRRSKGIYSSRLRLYPEAFLDIPFPVPSIQEQQLVLRELATVTAREETLASLSHRSLDRLRELRFALITAAVFGQIDVVIWGKRGETDRHLDMIEHELEVEREEAAV